MYAYTNLMISDKQRGMVVYVFREACGKIAASVGFFIKNEEFLRIHSRARARRSETSIGRLDTTILDSLGQDMRLGKKDLSIPLVYVTRILG